MAVRKRTRARELALQQLYAEDSTKDGPALDVDQFLRLQTDDEAIYLFALGLVHGTNRHRKDIDAEIRRCARNWDLRRLAVVDRNVLRLAVYELLFRPDIPARVTLNEAIELAKRFSTARSGAFVNGVLDRVRKDAGLAPDQTGPRPEGSAAEPEGETAEPLAASMGGVDEDEDENDVLGDERLDRDVPPDLGHG